MHVNATVLVSYICVEADIDDEEILACMSLPILLHMPFL